MRDSKSKDTGVLAKESLNMQNLQHPFKNSCDFSYLKVKLKPAGIELEFQNLWKERTNNKNCSWFLCTRNEML